MTTFSRPTGLREWLYDLEARIARLEAGGVRPIPADEDVAAEHVAPTEPVPRGNLEAYLRSHL